MKHCWYKKEPKEPTDKDESQIAYLTSNLLLSIVLAAA